MLILKSTCTAQVTGTSQWNALKGSHTTSQRIDPESRIVTDECLIVWPCFGDVECCVIFDIASLITHFNCVTESSGCCLCVVAMVICDKKENKVNHRTSSSRFSGLYSK